WENFCKIRASEGGDQQEDPQKKSEVPDAVHDKCLFGCIIIRIVLIPEADQEIRTQAHSFPADEHDRVTRAHDQDEHKKNEQIQVGKKLSEALVRVHVSRRINMDQKPNARTDQK